MALGAVLLSAAAAVALAPATASATPAQLAAAQLPAELADAISRDLKISPAEYIERAARAQELASYAKEFRATRPQEFAGAYLGQDGRPVVAVTSTQAAAIATRDGYQTHLAPISADGLEQSVAQLNRWLAALPRELARSVNSVTVDVLDSQIIVDVVNSPAGAALNLPTLLANVKVTLTPGGGGPVEPGPMSGDTYITTKGPLPTTPLSEIGVCSFGFNGVDNSGNALNISAGHCDPNVETDATNAADATVYLPNPRDIDRSAEIGRFIRSSLGSPDNGLDYSLIKFTQKAANGGLDQPTVRGANGTTMTVTGTATPVVGAPVCKSGQSSTFTCGIVAADRVETQLFTSDGSSRTVRGFASTACTLAGDSGGAIVTGTMALGITSGSNSSTAPSCAEANLVLAPYGGTASLGIPIQEILAAVDKESGGGVGSGIKLRTGSAPS